MAEEQTISADQDQENAGRAVAEAAAIMRRLRGPDGCPWDREQTFDSIKRHTLEETYEVFDAIERRAWPELRDELGDLLLQILFYAQMAAEEGHFTLQEVAEALSAKLIRRHPHIFADAVATDADAVLRNWEQIKREEKRAAGEHTAGEHTAGEHTAGEHTPQASTLDSIPRSMPAMLEAGKLGSKAAKAGFDWPNAQGLFAKLQEETQELHAELAADDPEGIEAEMGDLLFTAVNLARHLGVDPESALRRTNRKFRRRYRAMEQLAGGSEPFEALPLEHKEELWSQAKAGVAGDDPSS